MKGRAPTKAERDWMTKARELGCIVCWNQHGVYTEAAIHHIDGKTKPNAHLLTIPLCYNHHQGGADSGPYISRHPWKKRFQEAYGSEQELLEQTRHRCGEYGDS